MEFYSDLALDYKNAFQKIIRKRKKCFVFLFKTFFVAKNHLNCMEKMSIKMEKKNVIVGFAPDTHRGRGGNFRSLAPDTFELNPIRQLVVGYHI